MNQGTGLTKGLLALLGLGYYFMDCKAVQSQRTKTFSCFALYFSLTMITSSFPPVIGCDFWGYIMPNK